MLLSRAVSFIRGGHILNEIIIVYIVLRSGLLIDCVGFIGHFLLCVLFNSKLSCKYGERSCAHSDFLGGWVSLVGSQAWQFDLQRVIFNV